MPIPLLIPAVLVAAGWSIRAYADHEVANDQDDEDAEDGLEPSDDPNAESVWSAITNFDGLLPRGKDE